MSDVRADPGGTTFKKLMAYASRPAPAAQVATTPGKYFSHPDASKVTLKYGDKARKMTDTAEQLLKSILAASGIMSATLTSTRRTYHDQARITMTQTYPNRGASTVKQWYGQDVLDACKLYKKSNDIQGFADWWEARDKKRGRVSSKHLSNQALDVVPAKDRLKFVKQVKALVPVAGSGVKKNHSQRRHE